MKKSFALPLAMFVLIGLFVGGCSKDEVTSTTPDPNDQLYGLAQTDQQFFQMYAQNDEFFKSDEIAMDDGQTPQSMDDDGLGKVLSPIKPLRWARHITSFTRNAVLDSVTLDSLAYVTITKSWSGELLIAGTYNDTSSVPDTLLRKPFTEQSTKRIIFKRIARRNIIWRNWKPVAISLIDGGSTSSANIDINLLKIFYDNNGQPDSIVVTDPNSTFLRFKLIRDIQCKDIPDIAGGRQVRLQVTLASTDPDSDHVALRYGFSLDRLQRRRIRLHLVSESVNGGVYTRVYERTFNMHFKRGVFSAGVDAITHGTLFDDAAPVATSFWGVPYTVTR